MFNVGGGEVLVILLVALVVLGPDKLPGAMRSVGNMVGELRKLSNGFQSEMRNAMYTDDRPPTVGPVVGTSTDTTAREASAETEPEADNGGPDSRRANDALFAPPPDERRPTE